MTYIPPQTLPLTAFGDLRTSEMSPIFQMSLEYTVSNTELNTNTEVNGGTVTQATAMAVCGTSTTTASTALFQSKQHAKYRSGQGGLSRFTAIFTSPVSATEQLQGLADETGSSFAFENGYMVGYVGTTFGYHVFQNDSITTVAQSAWDDPMDGTGASGMTLDQTKLNVFAIQFQYLGAGAQILWIEDDSTGQFVKAHTHLYANLNTTPSVYNPNFYHTIWVNNKATTSDMVLSCASYAYFVEGKTDLIMMQQPQASSGNQSKSSVTTEVAIFTIRNKTTYASKNNFIDIYIEAASAAIEAGSANNLGSVRMVKNATLGGSPSYSDINTTNSVVEIDTAGTTVTGGIELLGTPLAGKNDKEIMDMNPFKFILNPGESMTFAGSSTNSATIDMGCLWKELF